MAAQKQAETAETPKKRGKLLIIISLAVVLLGGGGGAAWYFMRSSDAHAAPVEAKPKPAVFLPLESFTVNLMPNGGQPEFIQAGLTLKFDDIKMSDLAKERMPEVRNRILMVLSSKRGADLLPAAGKQKLAEELATAVKTIIDPTGAKPVAKAAPKPPVEEKAADGAEPDEAAIAEAKEAKAAEARAAKKAAEKAVKVEVLFTAFIIQ